MTTTYEISADADVIDSRDIIARFEAVEESFADCLADDENPWEAEYNLLLAFLEHADYVTDWEDGATLIHSDYFATYIKEMVSDIGDLPSDLPSYIESNIDWEGVADDMKVDYCDVLVNGQTFYVRA
jgi:hypothetical protein